MHAEEWSYRESMDDDMWSPWMDDEAPERSETEDWKAAYEEAFDHEAGFAVELMKRDEQVESLLAALRAANEVENR